jgi:hypothetical protein
MKKAKIIQEGEDMLKTNISQKGNKQKNGKSYCFFVRKKKNISNDLFLFKLIIT